MLLNLLIIVLGVYVLFSAIRGKGRLMRTEGIKDEYKEKLPQLMRILYMIIGIAMIVNGAGAMLRSYIYEFPLISEATEEAAAVYSSVPVLVEGMEEFAWLSYKALNVFSLVMMAISVTAVIVLFLLVRKMTDPNKRREEQEKAAQTARGNSYNAAQSGHTLPVNAFSFDENGDIAEPEPEQDGDAE